MSRTLIVAEHDGRTLNLSTAEMRQLRDRAWR